MRARPIGRFAVAVSAAVAVASLLTSCRTNVGSAADVNGQRISESTVNKYVSQEGVDSALAAQAAAQNQAVPLPRTLVLQTLVQEKLFEQAFAAHGGIPASGQLAAVHDKAVQQQFGSAAVGPALDRAAAETLQRLGITASFGPVVVRYSELSYLIVQKRELTTAVTKASAHVEVNPRYGVWEPSKLTVNSSSGAGLPDYLRLQPTPVGSAAAGVPAQ